MKLNEYYWSPTIELRKHKHQYINVESQIPYEIPSVTTLVSLLYPFPETKIDKDILRQAIDKGVCVHDRISEYIKYDTESKCKHVYYNIVDKTHQTEYSWLKSQLEQFIKINKITEYYSEVSMANDYYTGTFDLLYKDNDDLWHLVDFKTTTRFYKEKESLQLRLYEKLIIDNFEDVPSIESFTIYNTRHRTQYGFTKRELADSLMDFNKICEIKKIK
ncbi:hypothetical protein STIUS_v1c05020 [Spiroplasma sp. TIUS-1]|uniref:PD-(D/E)XK nuclease family protein n=1 Tax=Spiroplasma sp. TIUS-1 TaxID=216963 RepID=UPI001398F1B6|nr:PD-(D/E)XK nuclease family protein [Spiroplasma sp. TIUS-1]QHX36056.1 hypothetical protein STIUS_v1c05020 [Spiroplasma sp. TIUS-1]